MNIPFKKPKKYIVTNEDLKNLISGYGGKAQNYLHSHYSIFTPDDVDDIICDSIKILYEKSLEEDFHLTTALEGLFFGICKNKAKEVLRKKYKLLIDEEASEGMTSGTFNEGRINSVISLGDILDTAEKEHIGFLVDHLPHPCKELLGGFYWTGYNLTELSEMLNLSYDNVKTQISRCRKRFKENYLKNI